MWIHLEGRRGKGFQIILKKCPYCTQIEHDLNTLIFLEGDGGDLLIGVPQRLYFKLKRGNLWSILMIIKPKIKKRRSDEMS